jgi:hypothetical protein
MAVMPFGCVLWKNVYGAWKGVGRRPISILFILRGNGVSGKTVFDKWKSMIT